MSKKKSAKKSARVPASAASAEAGNGRHHSEGGNGADRVGETPHPAANGGAGHADARRDAEMDENMDLLPERIRRQLESIRQRSQEAQDLSREARDNYESARKTLEKFHQDSEKRMRDLEEKARQQAEEFREQNLRLRAEVENIRKRAAEQMENIRKYAVESFADGVCEVRDCLESAMQSPPENAQALREGVQLTLRKLASVMDAHGIHPVNPDIGAPFDPDLHQAVAKSADAPQPRNTVAAVVRKGYTIHERTLRPADVIVSIRNGAPTPTPTQPSQSAQPESKPSKSAKTSGGRKSKKSAA